MEKANISSKTTEHDATIINDVQTPTVNLTSLLPLAAASMQVIQ